LSGYPVGSEKAIPPRQAQGYREEWELSTQTEFFDQRAVALNVNALEVPQETTTTTDHEQQSATGVVVVLVLFEVLGQFNNAVGHQRNLDLGRTGVTGVSRIRLNDFCFYFLGHYHVSSPFVSLRGAAPGVVGLS
jgi:hypothetical protein